MKPRIQNQWWLECSGILLQTFESKLYAGIMKSNDSFRTICCFHLVRPESHQPAICYAFTPWSRAQKPFCPPLAAATPQEEQRSRAAGQAALPPPARSRSEAEWLRLAPSTARCKDKHTKPRHRAPLRLLSRPQHSELLC